MTIATENRSIQTHRHICDWHKTVTHMHVHVFGTAGYRRLTLTADDTNTEILTLTVAHITHAYPDRIVATAAKCAAYM